MPLPCCAFHPHSEAFCICFDFRLLVNDPLSESRSIVNFSFNLQVRVHAHSWSCFFRSCLVQMSPVWDDSLFEASPRLLQYSEDMDCAAEFDSKFSTYTFLASSSLDRILSCFGLFLEWFLSFVGTYLFQWLWLNKGIKIVYPWLWLMLWRSPQNSKTRSTSDGYLPSLSRHTKWQVHTSGLFRLAYIH